MRVMPWILDRCAVKTQSEIQSKAQLVCIYEKDSRLFVTYKSISLHCKGNNINLKTILIQSFFIIIIAVVFIGCVRLGLPDHINPKG